jgi:multidrug resistance efflux pump
MNLNKKGIFVLGLLGLLALMLAVLTPSIHFKNGIGSHSQASQSSERPWPLFAKGIVESKDAVNIASTVEGQVSKMLVSEGDYVRVGQLLCRLDTKKIEAKISAAEAALARETARRVEAEDGYRPEDIASAQYAYNRASAISSEALKTYERNERLYHQGAVTRVGRDQAKEAWLVAQANTREAEALLSKMLKGPRSEEIAAAQALEKQAHADLVYYRSLFSEHEIISPINGMIVNKYKEPFETVDIGTPILQIVNPDNLQVWAEVEEADVGRIKKGQKVIVTVDSQPGQEFNGEVTNVYVAVQRKSQKSFDPVATFDVNTQKLLIDLTNYNGLVHGMSVTVKFLK